jgi:Flp pilus assembly protein TadD
MVADITLGDVAVAAGDLPKALASFTDAISVALRLAAQDPSNTEWQRDLSVSHDRIGDVQVAQRNLTDASE